MGSCLGRCLPHSACRHSNSMDFTHLIEEKSFPYSKPRRLLEKLFFKKKPSKSLKEPVLELVDEMLNPPLSFYNRLSESYGESQQLPSTSSGIGGNDIPMQCLDARALMDQTAMSTPASSLDLEWEHEMLPISVMKEPAGRSWTQQEEDARSDTAPICNSESWSRVSPGNSLEWDCVSLNTADVDTDTQVLLNEIERLTMQTLQETGRDLYS